jgi:hypothetical protein
MISVNIPVEDKFYKWNGKAQIKQFDYLNSFLGGLLSIKEHISFYSKSEYFYTLNYPNANNCRASIANDQLSG